MSEDTGRPGAAADPAGSGKTRDTGTSADPDAQPRELLSELAVLRRRVRTARHAYWFPLALFGLIGCGTIPFYLAGSRPAPTSGVFVVQGAIPALPVVAPGAAGLPGAPVSSVLLGFYWLLALVGGFLVMMAWYRRHARRAGVTSAARGAASTGIILTALVLVLWPVSRLRPGWPGLLFPWFLTIHGMFPFLIIAVSLFVLARAERSWGLTAIAVLFLTAALVACSYDVENVIGRLGYFSSAAWFGVLPNLALPVGVLLLSGAAVLGARRWQAAR